MTNNRYNGSIRVLNELRHKKPCYCCMRTVKSQIRLRMICAFAFPCPAYTTVKHVYNLIFKTDYRLMQVKSIAECSKGEHSAICLTFIELPFVIKILVLSIFEWPFYAGFTVFLFISGFKRE